MAGARTIRRRMENALKGATGSDVIELTEYLLSNVPSPHFERLLARAIKRHQLKEVEEKLNGGLEIVSVDSDEHQYPSSGRDNSSGISDANGGDGERREKESDSVPVQAPE